jgi:hypothetical protein
MLKSDSITLVAAALVQARRDVGIAIKNAANPHLKNRYADLGAVMDAIGGALGDNDLTPFQTPDPSDDGKLHLTTIILHKSGEYIGGEMVMPISKQDPQGFGSALTYARRYALAAALNVTQDDDDGARAAAWREEAANQPAHDSQITQINTLLSEYGRTWEQLSDVYPSDHRYKGKPLESVTAEDMATIIKFVRGRLDATDKQTA